MPLANAGNLHRRLMAKCQVPSAFFLLLIHHWISQSPRSLHAHLNYISRDHRADAFGRAGGDQVPGEKCHHLRDVADDNLEGKNEISGVALLAELAILASFDLNARPGIDLIGDQRSDWAEGIE